MQVQDEDGIEFLDLKFKLENNKIPLDVFALSPPTVSYMCYLLVAMLERVSIIYYVA